MNEDRSIDRLSDYTKTKLLHLCLQIGRIEYADCFINEDGGISTFGAGKETYVEEARMNLDMCIKAAIRELICTVTPNPTKGD